MDDDDLRRFMASGYPELVAALTFISGSQPSAEEAVQEALFRAWQQADNGLDKVSLEAWVRVAALNLIRTHFRRAARERRALDRLAAQLDRSVPSRSDRAGDLVDLVRALACLTPRQREAITLHYRLELSVLEVAEVLDVAEGTVKALLHQARTRLLPQLRSADPVDPTPTSKGSTHD